MWKGEIGGTGKEWQKKEKAGPRAAHGSDGLASLGNEIILPLEVGFGED